jgi:hypothetical protein
MGIPSSLGPLCSLRFTGVSSFGKIKIFFLFIPAKNDRRMTEEDAESAEIPFLKTISRLLGFREVLEIGPAFPLLPEH